MSIAFDSKAKAVWKKLCTLLASISEMTEADGLELERLRDCYADVLTCQKPVERDDRVYTTIHHNNNALIKNNPTASQLHAAVAEFKSHLVYLKLMPAARLK